MAHYNYYLDLTVETFIVHEDAVLLRMHDKYHLWMGPGGHIEAGEDINEAAIREAWEEVGLRIELVGPMGWVNTDTDTNTDLVPPLFMNRHRINEVHEHSASIFAAKATGRTIQPQAGEDVDCECVWVTKEELAVMAKEDARLRPETYRYAVAALDLVKH